jgi:hypothetical protein
MVPQDAVACGRLYFIDVSSRFFAARAAQYSVRLSPAEAEH